MSLTEFEDEQIRKGATHLDRALACYVVIGYTVRGKRMRVKKALSDAHLDALETHTRDWIKEIEVPAPVEIERTEDDDGALPI